MEKSAPNSQPVTLPSFRKNAILKHLQTRPPRRFANAGALLHLALRQHIYESEHQIHDVYFPLDCVLSVVARMRDGTQIEIGTIGREGMSAFPLLMGASSTANFCYCQVRGSAIKIPARLVS